VADAEDPAAAVGPKTRFSVAVALNPEHVHGRGPRFDWFKWYVLDVYPNPPGVGHAPSGYFTIRRHWARILIKLSLHRYVPYKISAGSHPVEVQVVDGTFWLVVVPYNAR
jgi:hypothetical protein